VSTPGEQRRLAAIMFTDMVGYSALSQRDDQLALELLEEHREILRKIFPEFNGIEIKTIADAFLVEFNSALEAAQCAIEIQRALVKRNSDVPDDRRIELKIGIHIGDVVHRGGDVYGDGVNIASRIEPLAGAGGICISMDVERQIRNAVEMRLEKLAPTELKNISVPMDLFRIVLPWEKQSPRGPTQPAISSARSRLWTWAGGAAILLLVVAIGWWWTTLTRNRPPAHAESANPTIEPPKNIPEKSIAVLPFENLSDDKANTYFTEGIQDEILTRLSKIAALKVISRTSTQKYKSAPENLREIGKQLGVAHIVEGSVQKIANAVHINVQLIRATDDGHIWAESYDRKLNDIFVVEGEVAQKVAEALNATLTGDEKQRLAQIPTSNSAAYEAYLRGLSLLREDTDAMIRGAIDAFSEAVRLDPQFALAWARLAEENALLYFYFDTTPARRATAEQCVLKVEQLQPQLPEAHLARAYFQYWGMHDYKGARDLLLQLRLIWPGNADIIQALAWISARLGDWTGSNSYFQQAITLNPRDLFLRTGAACLRMEIRDFSGAQQLIDEALGIWPNEPSLLGLKAEVFQATGALDEAQAAINQLKGQTDNIFDLPAIALQARLRRQPAQALQFFEEQLARAKSNGDQETALWFVGQFQDLMGDKAAAKVTYLRLREMTENRLQRQPENTGDLRTLAFVLAILGDRDAALRSLDKAAALAANDARDAPALEELRIRILIRFGEKDRALSALPSVLQAFYGSTSTVPLTPALLRLDPDFDPLRADPRFEKLCE